MFGGQVVECDTIVVANGVQPATDLALTAGLRVGRGIKVNDHMQTSDPLIYAVGDCAEHRASTGWLAPVSITPLSPRSTSLEARLVSRDL